MTTARLQPSDPVPFPGIHTGDSSGNSLDVTPVPSSPQSTVTPHGSPHVQPDPPQQSPDTQTSSEASQLTSSDKLTALPALASNRARPRHRSLESSPAHSNASSNFDAVDVSFSSLPPSNTWNTKSSTHPVGGASGSSSPGTPHQRVSFDSDRLSLPALNSARQVFTRHGRGTDPMTSSPVLRPADKSPSLKQKDLPPESPTSQSASRSRSRAASPLRMLHQWSANLHRPRRDEQFVPVNPFKLGWKFEFPWICVPCKRDQLGDHDDDDAQLIHHPRQGDVEQQYLCDEVLPMCCCPSRSSWANTHMFLIDTLPRQLYLYFLLRLPALYFSRVARIFEDAEVSKPDIQRMIECGLSTGFGQQGGPAEAPNGGTNSGSDAAHRNIGIGIRNALASAVGITAHIGGAAAGGSNPLPFPEDWTPPLVSPALIRFKNSWEDFINSLVKEWKTLNIVSALLLSAILTIFQIPSAAEDPLTRNFALFSLICALMSLTYGCVYIVRFGTMRSMYRASRWAEEARKSYTVIWWNVWVLLAMPSVWLAWSMIAFIMSILSFVWRTGSTDDPPERDPLSPRTALAPRIIITFMLFLGLVYFVLIINTLKRYGTHIGERGVGRVSGISMSLSGIHRGSDRDLQLDRDRTRANEAARGTTRERHWADLAGESRGQEGRRGSDVPGRDVDAAMERRGRERERSGSRSVRRRDRASGPRSEDNEKKTMDADVEEKVGKEKDDSLIGLGLLGVDASSAKPEDAPREDGDLETIQIDIQIDKGTVSRQ